MPGTSTRRDRVVLVFAVAVLLVSAAAIGAVPSPHTRVAVFVGIYAVAFTAYLVAVGAVLRRSRPVVVAPLAIVAVCALAHAFVIPARPDLSTDIYRYTWEGRLLANGHNPFSAPPADSAFVALRDADFARIGMPHMPTIYPPLAQAAFCVAAWVHPGPTTLKVLFSLFNLGTALVLVRLLRRRGIPASRALIFAWNPLVIIETAHSGHVDAMAAFFLVLAIDLWESKRRAWAGLALGASALVKYLAVALVPWLARRRHVAAIAITAGVVVAGYIPFLDAGAGLFSSLRVYSETWRFNGPPFLVLSGFLGDPVISRRLLAGGCIAFALAAAYRERDPARYAYLVVGCTLLVSPTVYPWYLVWILPLLCLFPSYAWIAFSGLVVLSYGVWNMFNETGEWVVPAWLLVLEYAPFYLLLLSSAARLRGRARVPA